MFVRLIVFLNSGYSFLGVDENYYLGLSRDFIKGVPFKSFFLPGWPFVLSLFFRVFDGILAARLFVIVAGSVTPALVYMLGEKIYSKKVGLVAGLLMAFYPEHIFFSHYIQAEIILEILIILVTLLSFHNSQEFSKPRLLLMVFLLMGLGLLYKHFIVLPFIVLWSLLLYCRRSVVFLVAVGGLFILPTLVYGLYTLRMGGDPLLLINSPLKSADEWSHGKAANFTAQRKGDFLKAHIDSLRERGLSGVWQKTKWNIFNLWTPNAHHITRLSNGHYKGFKHPWVSIYLSVAFFTFLLVVGAKGFIFGEMTLFRLYSVGNFTVLSMMCLGVFMISRYRFPFIFLLALSAAEVAVNVRRPHSDFFHQKWGRVIIFVFFIITVGFIYYRKLPRLGSWF